MFVLVHQDAHQENTPQKTNARNAQKNVLPVSMHKIVKVVLITTLTQEQTVLGEQVF